MNTKPNPQIKATSGRLKILTNLSESAILSKIYLINRKKSLNNNITADEVKRIMRRFLKFMTQEKIIMEHY